MKLPVQIFLVSTARGHHRCGSDSKNHERHPLIQEGPVHPNNLLQALDTKPPPLSIPNKEDEDLFRAKGPGSRLPTPKPQLS